MTEIQIPEEYNQKSKQVIELWEQFVQTGENLDKIILEMRDILESSGLSRTNAMKKIAEDHRQLKGFSLRTLYRILPLEHKQQQASKVKNKEEGLPFGNELELQETNQNNINITTNHNITEVDSIPEPHVTTLEIQKASELDDNVILEKDKEIETQKKMILDKNEHIQQLEIKVERLTDQVDAQATKLKEYMKQETTITDPNKPKEPDMFPFTLPEKQLFMQCEKCHTGNTHIISGRVYSKKEWVPYQDHTAEQKQRLEKWGKV